MFVLCTWNPFGSQIIEVCKPVMFLLLKHWLYQCQNIWCFLPWGFGLEKRPDMKIVQPPIPTFYVQSTSHQMWIISIQVKYHIKVLFLIGGWKARPSNWVTSGYPVSNEVLFLSITYNKQSTKFCLQEK